MEGAGSMPHVTHMAKSQRMWASERGKNSEKMAKQAVKKKQGIHRRYLAVFLMEAKRVLKAQLKRRRYILILEGEQP